MRELAKRVDDHERRLKRIESMLQTKEVENLIEEVSKDQDVVLAFKALEIDDFSYIYSLSGISLYLAVLQIAKEELNVDGLTPPEISQICKDKIRISVGVDRTTISNALREAGARVDRIDNPRGRGFAYRIMKAGEQFLQDSIGENQAR